MLSYGWCTRAHRHMLSEFVCDDDHVWGHVYTCAHAQAHTRTHARIPASVISHISACVCTYSHTLIHAYEHRHSCIPDVRAPAFTHMHARIPSESERADIVQIHGYDGHLLSVIGQRGCSLTLYRPPFILYLSFSLSFARASDTMWCIPSLTNHLIYRPSKAVCTWVFWQGSLQASTARAAPSQLVNSILAAPVPRWR